MSFAELWRELEPLGRDAATGGYRRYSWTPADAQCRAWFTRQAKSSAWPWKPDNNGNLWAWWDPEAPQEKTPSSPAATWTRSPTAGATTERSASCPRWPPWKC